MPHDQAYLEAEKQIDEAKQSIVINAGNKIFIVTTRGGNHGA
jgi:hypothetical protein